MTIIIDLNIQHLLDLKYKIQNCKNWFKRSYWFKQSELQKIDTQLQDIISNNFTRVILPENKYSNFTFDDIFKTYLDYYIFDYSYIPLGKYMNTYYHNEKVGFVDPVQIQYVNAIFEKDSTGSNIYVNNNSIISRPVYVKTLHMNSVTV
jgi:hypothetical protein